MKKASSIGAVLSMSLCLFPASAQFEPPAPPRQPSPKPEKKPDPKATNQDPAPLTQEQAREALSALATGDWQAREAATSKLIDGGEEAIAALEQGLLSSDPEVRLRCLYVLRRADVLSEQLLSTMLEKSTTDESIEAVYALRKDRKSFRRAILKRVPELARNKSDRRQMQLLTITLDMVREVARPEDADEVASFLALDLRDAHGFGSPLSILVEALAKLPRDAVMVRARAIAAERAAEAEAYPRTQALAAIAALGGASELPVIRTALASPGQSIREAALEAPLARRPRCR
jgi:HEAT repeat protein